MPAHHDRDRSHRPVRNGIPVLPRWWVGPVSLIAVLLSSCTSYESHYEKGVYHLEPIYCYQTIGSVDCHRQPDARDADRLVNYYGPAPSKYDPPEPPHLNTLRAPPKGQGYWRAPEPIPGPPPETPEDNESNDTFPAAPAGTPPAPTDAPASELPKAN